MKNIFTFFFSFVSIIGFSQTDLSGVINSYAAVNSIDTCAASLTVSSTLGFVPGEDLLIIQMQGATMSESNNSSFGDITDLGSAGLFEKCKIKSVSGNTIEVENYFVNTYDPNGSVQIVSFPEYVDARIVNTVISQPWDGIVGGIVALNVTGNLTFEGSIDVSGAGFRGGISQALSNTCTGGINNASAYFYDQTNWRGAKKGEGIAKYISDKDFGRGAQANGGGGGNDHNSGGGGGGNYTSGGIGGERELGFFSLECRGTNPGEAGKPINVTDNRIFFGGGGGAGHVNNNSDAKGGNGGGMVFCTANNVFVLPGGKISANGDDLTIPARGDGSGGGGAGGSIVLKIENLNDNLDLEAIGGFGGDVDNRNTDRSFGPGGGGSGGVIKEEITNRINNTQTFNFLDGGRPGITTNTPRSSNNTSNGAEEGTSGRKSTYLGIPQSDETPGAPVFVTQPALAVLTCEGIDVTIEGEASGLGLTYQWQLLVGTNYLDLLDGVEYTGTQTPVLMINSPVFSFTGNQYRLIASNGCGDEAISDVSVLTVQVNAIADFNFIVTGTEVRFVDASIAATGLLWNFGNNNTSQIPNPIFDFGTAGTYTVELVASGPCGIDRITKTIVIADNAAPTADFSTDNRIGCPPTTFQLINNSSTNADNFEWFFPGGSPATSLDESPNVSYTTPGNYDVILVAFNANGNDTLVRSGFFGVRSQPIADFDFVVAGQDVTFSDLSINADSYRWQFGDSETSLAQNPVHTYVGSGTFTVRLISENPCGTDTTFRVLTIGNLPNAAFSSDKVGGCAPMSVNFSDESIDGITRTWFFPGGTPATSSDADVRVIYNTPGAYDVQLIIENGAGSDTSFMPNFIEAFPRPFAGFEFTANGTQVDFNNTSTGGGDYMWDFGDGSAPSTEPNPSHTFPGNGSYVVTLNATNEFCSGSFTQTVNVTTSSIDEYLNENSIQIYPNPVSEFLNIEIENPNLRDAVNIDISDISGKIIFSKKEVSNKELIDTGRWRQGIYFINFTSKEGGKFITKLVKTSL